MSTECGICGKRIETGDDGAMLAFGYWKSAGDDPDPDFDPIGEEFDTCRDCAVNIRKAVSDLIQRR